MTSLLPPRTRPPGRSRDRSRSERPIELTTTVPADPGGRGGGVLAPLMAPRHSWILFAFGAGLLGAALGWVLISGVAVLGWLSADPGSLVGALGVGTQLWLLTNGAGAVLGTGSVTLTPLGVTLVWVMVLGRLARVAARAADGVRPVWVTLGVAGLATAGYLAALVTAVLLVGGGGGPELWTRLVRATVGGALTAGPICAWQAARVSGWRPAESWPGWLRAVPRALGLALAVLLVTGAAALTTGIWVHRDRVAALWQGLDPGVLGGIVLLVIQLAYLPVAVVWASAYTLGSGFGLGAGSVVAPRATDLGLLPSLPLLGATPTEGAGSPWQLAWLAGGVVAGAVAAVLVVRRGDVDGGIRRPDLGALAGGLISGVAGLLAVGVAWLSRGGWGTGRLAELGPGLLPLVIIAPVTLGLAGTFAGFFLGLVPLVRQWRADRRLGAGPER